MINLPEDFLDVMNGLPTCRAIVCFMDNSKPDESERKMLLAMVDTDGNPMAARWITLNDAMNVLENIEMSMLATWPETLQNRSMLLDAQVKGGAN